MDHIAAHNSTCRRDLRGGSRLLAGWACRYSLPDWLHSDSFEPLGELGELDEQSQSDFGDSRPMTNLDRYEHCPTIPPKMMRRIGKYLRKPQSESARYFAMPATQNTSIASKLHHMNKRDISSRTLCGIAVSRVLLYFAHIHGVVGFTLAGRNGDKVWTRRAFVNR